MWKTGGWIAWFYSMMLTLFVTAVLRKGDKVGKDANQIDRKSSTTEVVVCSSGKWHILLPLLLAIFFLVNHACIWLAGDVLFCVKKVLVLPMSWLSHLNAIASRHKATSWARHVCVWWMNPHASRRCSLCAFCLEVMLCVSPNEIKRRSQGHPALNSRTSFQGATLHCRFPYDFS